MQPVEERSLRRTQLPCILALRHPARHPLVERRPERLELRDLGDLVLHREGGRLRELERLDGAEQWSP